MSVYLDCNATTPIEPAVRMAMSRFLEEEYGNAGSRTHEWGNRAKAAAHQARDYVAALIGVERDSVIFTSGATESNNIALLGLRAHGESTGRRHLITSAIEHKAVLEPMAELVTQGFELTTLPVGADGRVDPQSVHNALRVDTLLVSIMQANNETGVIQPIDSIASVLVDHEAYFHVDAAQGYGKEIDALRHARIDLISISGHKLYAPKGIGALIMRRRGFKLPPLTPLMFGGGQERGLRPGTLPVHLAVALGEAARIAQTEHGRRAEKNTAFRRRLMTELGPLEPTYNGDQSHVLPHVVNLSFADLDSEAVMVALKPFVAISNGSACTSHSYTPSHVLKAMGLSDDRIAGALRWSWCHQSEEPNWGQAVQAIRRLR